MVTRRVSEAELDFVQSSLTRRVSNLVKASLRKRGISWIKCCPSLTQRVVKTGSYFVAIPKNLIGELLDLQNV